MTTRFVNKLIYFLLITLITIFLSSGSAIAAEITVTENGGGSSNEANVSSNTQTTVEQNNNATVSNNVTSNADSGGNVASNNTGGTTTIQSGEAASAVEVKNEVNTSKVDTACCPSNSSNPSEVTITGNGSDSSNAANASMNTTTTVSINNNATVTTVINGTANTGKNKADFNSGNVLVQTGNAKVTGEVINVNINNARVSLSQTTDADFTVKIGANGAGSANTVNKSSTKNVVTLVQNNSDILNITNWFANTGKNSASFNIGDVSIFTGTATVETIINNTGINSSTISLDCGCKEQTPPPPPCTSNCGNGGGCNENCGGTPGTTGGGGGGGNGGGGGSSGGGNGGSVLGIDTGGSVLPGTGSMLNMWLTLLAFLLFCSGLFLKSRSGRSPNLSFDIA